MSFKCGSLRSYASIKRAYDPFFIFEMLACGAAGIEPWTRPGAGITAAAFASSLVTVLDQHFLLTPLDELRTVECQVLRASRFMHTARTGA